MTIAELRRKEVYKLAKRINAEPTESEVNDARRLMNSFYRYVGLRLMNFELENNESTCNTTFTKKSCQKEDVWYGRLTKNFAKYGLQLELYGLYPSITDAPGHSDVIYTYYYQ